MAKWFYPFYRSLLLTQKLMTIARREMMLETKNGIVTVPGPVTNYYSISPSRCKHTTPRRWAGKIGKFLLCDHCGAVWRLTSEAREPEVWEELAPRPFPGAPLIPRPKAKGKDKPKSKAAAVRSSPSASSASSPPSFPPQASTTPSADATSFVTTESFLLSSDEDPGTESKISAGADWLMDNEL